MKNEKITLIGGGSLLWAPKLLGDFVLSDELQESQMCLHDIDEKALTFVYHLGKKITGEAKKEFHLTSTTSLEEALADASYVILCISVGGNATMRYDLEIPLRYGIYQSVGDTVGPGGLSRALRSIPVAVDMCNKMEDLCPDAWLINCTNPMSTLCRAISKTTCIKTIGVCHERHFVLQTLKRILQIEEAAIQAKTAGINHFTWITELKVKGEDGFPLLREYIKREEKRLKRGIDTLDWESFYPFNDNNLLKFELFNTFGYLPAAGDRHIAEFFPSFLTEETQAGRKYGIKLTTIEDRIRRMEQTRENLLSIIDGKQPVELKHSEEKVCDIIAAIATGKQGTFMINMPNQGQITNLPFEVIVETPALVDANGVYPLPVGEIPPGILGLMFHHITNQEMIVEAALTGDNNLALQAFVNDPLVRNVGDAPKMLEELLQANAEYLSQFQLQRKRRQNN
jgi:alpha-galactosidase